MYKTILDKVRVALYVFVVLLQLEVVYNVSHTIFNKFSAGSVSFGILEK